MNYTFYAIDRTKRAQKAERFTPADNASACKVSASCPELALSLETVFDFPVGHTAVRGRLSDTTGKDRAVSLFFAIPVRGTKLVWHDDIRRFRRISGKKLFENTEPATCGTGAMSIYPIGTVSGLDENGAPFCTSIGLDPTQPGQFRIGYDAANSELRIQYDFALVADTARFPSAAEFRFVIFDSDPDWGFRGAYAKYMDIFPAQFAVRAKKQGIWMPFTEIDTVEGFEDFGFGFHEMHGTGNDFDSTHGIPAFFYTEPFTWWMDMPPEMERTYENAVAMVDKLTEGDYPLKSNSTVCYEDAKNEYVRRAIALRQSGMRQADGKYFVQFFNLPWCNGACWIMNPNPDQPGEINGATINWSERHSKERHGLCQQLSGEYIDSTEGYTTPELNFDRGAFQHETLPLSFDAKTKQPGIFKGISVFEFTRKIGADMHAMNKMLFGNGLPYRFPWLLANFDIMGTETVWLGEDKSYAPIPDAQMALWRTLSGKKPYLLLQNTNFKFFDHSMVERYMQRVLFYALYPSMFSVDAASDPYWKNPALYNRDRDLFKHYVPLIRELGEAGWEPVTRAKSSSKNILVERYGTRYLALCNETTEPQSARITVDFPVRREATERISGKTIPVSAKGVFSVELAPQSSAMIDFGK